MLTPKKLGFGCMRLPLLDSGKVDIEQFKKMVDMFLSRGFTYFDTAFMYLDSQSESALGEALVKRYPRESFTIADKLPYHQLKCKEDVERIFAEQQRRLGIDYFDFYLLHNANTRSCETFDKYDAWSFLESLKESGKARYVGFSCHDSAEGLDKLLTAHPFVDFVQLQINYLDWYSDSVQAKACYETARRHGKFVTVMEPVKGGYLATPCKEAAKLLEEAVPGCSPAAAAVRFAASLDGVLVALSGMSDLSQMEDNSGEMTDFVPLSDEQMDTILKAGEIIASIPTIGCTSCKYCEEACPLGIRIPRLISCLNDIRRFGLNQKTYGAYLDATEDANGPAECIKCGSCQKVCPQHLGIPGYLLNLQDAVAKRR